MRFLKNAAIIAGLLLAPSLLSAQTDVIIDQIVIEDPSNTTHPVIETALDLKSGDALSRDDLDEKLARGKQRLEALGYFKTVDLSLRKGQTRNHFDVVATLTPISSYYYGANYLRNEFKTNDDRDETKTSSDLYQLFVGTRDLFETGLRSELSVSSLDTTQVTSASSFNSDTNSNNSLIGPMLSLHSSSILGTDFFGGLAFSYIKTRSRFEYSSYFNQEQSTHVYRNKGGVSFSFVSAGRRFGLTTASIGIMRIMGNYKEEDTSYPADETTGGDHSFTYEETSIQPLLQYSEKSGLAQVEPGIVLVAKYSRTTAPSWLEPNLLLRATSTHLVGFNQALTPEINYQYSWYEDWGRLHTRTGLERLYDLSLLYEYITSQNLVLSAKAGYLQTHGSQGDNYSYPKQRFKFGVAYLTSSLNIDISFMYGESEIDQDATITAFLPDPSRFTQ